MPKATKSSWKKYFYNPNDLKSEKHGTIITPKVMNQSESNRYFQHLSRDVFSHHVLRNPRQLEFSQIRYSSRVAESFYRKEDISHLFVNEYYEYPDILPLPINGWGTAGDMIRSGKVFETILGQIADPKGIVVFEGEIGEGKSAFLSKFALDLKSLKSDKKYYPLIIDMHNYNDIVNGELESSAAPEFWYKIGEYIIEQLEKDQHIFIPSEESIADTIEKRKKVKGGLSIPAIIANFKASIEGIWIRKYVREQKRAIDIYKRIIIAAEELNSGYNTRLVLIFDNLDTFRYEHERYMLFKSGFKALKTRISTVHSIFWGVISRVFNSEISFIFTVRPYVYRHVFQTKLHYQREITINGRYRLCKPEADLPMYLRIEMLRKLVFNLKDNKRIGKGKKDIIEEYVDEFTHALDTIITKKDVEPFDKLLPLSNQGFRSIINFFESLYHHPELLFNYFSHDILYLYMLSKRSLYAQVPPDERYDNPVSFFPNVFLIMCDNYTNSRVPEANKPNRLTFWLKYLILSIVRYGTEVRIKDILQTLSSYDNHAVRLCLGSLSTTNEYNCLSLNFTGNINTLGEIEDTTYVSLSERGRFLIENDYCFSFECLQLYFDDWLLPRPTPEHMNLSNKDISELLEREFKDDTYSYDYMLNSNKYEYAASRKKIVLKKARQSLLLLCVLKYAEEYEMYIYKESWDKLKDLIGDSKVPFLSKENYTNIQRSIIEESCDIMRDDAFRKGIEYFATQVDAESTNVENFFNKVKT